MIQQNSTVRVVYSSRSLGERYQAGVFFTPVERVR
jgi:hypothetical protein